MKFTHLDTHIRKSSRTDMEQKPSFITQQENDLADDAISHDHPRSGVENDPVNSPNHYADKVFVECIDAMVHCYGIEEVQIYAKIAAFKYQWRSNQKHTTPHEDLKKAEWYLAFHNGKDPRKIR